MVRLKYRYLLVHILNPEPALPKAKTVPDPTDKPLPDLVQFHSPSPDDLTPQLLVRALKDQIQYLYGDYGLGLVASSLVGTFSPFPFPCCSASDSPKQSSQIPLPRNLHRHRSLLARPLPHRLGGAFVHDSAA